MSPKILENHFWGQQRSAASLSEDDLGHIDLCKGNQWPVCYTQDTKHALRAEKLATAKQTL